MPANPPTGAAATCLNCGCTDDVSDLRTGPLIQHWFGGPVICSECLAAWRNTFITDPDELKRYVLEKEPRAMAEPTGAPDAGQPPRDGSFRFLARNLRKQHERDEAHRRLADRAHALAMAVLQSPTYAEHKPEVDAVLEMVTVYGIPRVLAPEHEERKENG